MSNVEETIARIYTINFSKAWLTPKHKRTDRVVNMIKEFAIKHMKSSQIKIDQELNRYIWEKGKTNPPRKVRVRIVKDEDDHVIVSLYEDAIKETENNKLKDESPIDTTTATPDTTTATPDTTTATPDTTTATPDTDKKVVRKTTKKKSSSKQ
ncbi:MAG TPA: 50S ribosomal protein L31e [Phototrophicaceae bacterium]|nr:50S ribosomal protein L31e [Phototrophicaceae bacterium]